MTFFMALWARLRKNKASAYRGGGVNGGHALPRLALPPPFLEVPQKTEDIDGVPTFEVDVDQKDCIQRLFNEIESFLKSKDGKCVVSLGGEDREIVMTTKSVGEFDHLFVKLKSSTIKSQLVLWISIETLYSVGCRGMTHGKWDGKWLEFGDGKNSVIPDSIPLNFGKSYKEMFLAANPDFTFTDEQTETETASSNAFHADLLIGELPLRDAIKTLTNPNFTKEAAAVSMMGLCTMICESLRFKKYLKKMNEALERNEQIPVGVQDLPLLVMWGSSCKVFFYLSLHSDDSHETLLKIKNEITQEKQRLNEIIREKEIMYILMEEVGIFKRKETSGFTSDPFVTKFLKDFKRRYGILKKARKA